ncbi:MAG TPA: nucleotidyltransferase domain-containing protein [Spirochaetia bacterium]|nr:nucleotidyltransferase domain-containing protein [Spirochaetia bacterium]
MAEWKKGKEEKVFLERCKNLIRKVEENATVILYGSRARGDESPESDYDLLVLLDGPVNLRRENSIRFQIFDFQLETEHVISVSAFNLQDWESPLYKAMPFWQNVDIDGVVI